MSGWSAKSRTGQLTIAQKVRGDMDSRPENESHKGTDNGRGAADSEICRVKEGKMFESFIVDIMYITSNVVILLIFGFVLVALVVGIIEFLINL